MYVSLCGSLLIAHCYIQYTFSAVTLDDVVAVLALGCSSIQRDSTLLITKQALPAKVRRSIL